MVNIDQPPEGLRRRVFQAVGTVSFRPEARPPQRDSEARVASRKGAEY